jgi:hypothetical protein
VLQGVVGAIATRILTPLDQRFRLSPRGKRSVAAAVALLLLHRRPSTVVRLVISVWVDSVDGVPGSRTSAHVRDEVFEGPQPAIAHPDSATAIRGVRFMMFEIAAFLDGTPRFVLRISSHSVRAIPGRRRIGGQTSARKTFPFSQWCPSHGGSFSAITSTLPHDHAVRIAWRICNAQHEPSAKALTCYVDRFHCFTSTSDVSACSLFGCIRWVAWSLITF